MFVHGSFVPTNSLWVSRTGSASDWCALQETLYKCIHTIQYNCYYYYYHYYYYYYYYSSFIKDGLFEDYVVT